MPKKSSGTSKPEKPAKGKIRDKTCELHIDTSDLVISFAGTMEPPVPTGHRKQVKELLSEALAETAEVKLKISGEIQLDLE